MQWMGEQITKGKNIKVCEKRGKKWKIQMSRNMFMEYFRMKNKPYQDRYSCEDH